MSTLVRLDADRQVVVGASAAGRPLWATWGLHEPPDVHSWPCLAPDGRRWAALRVGREGGAARVVISTADAIETETEPLDGIPVCLQWSPAGARLAVLVQRAEGLALLVVDAGGGRAEVWCAGSPLFFAWIDEGRIAVHVGRGGGRTEVAVLEGGRSTLLPGTPGAFCAPVVTPSGIVWTARQPGGTSVLVTAPTGLPSRELERVEGGLVALVPTADGQVLRAVAADADGQRYQDLRRLDPASGRTVRITDLPMAAFQPVPDGSVVVLQRDERRGGVDLLHVSADGQSERRLGGFAPSRDQRFWIRFFEQYAPSHPLVDPQGAAVAASGSRSEGEPAHVWRWPLAGGDATDLGEGPFACFAPARPGPQQEGAW